MSATITYSDGSSIVDPVVNIWDDLHSERPGALRAFWSAKPDPDAESGSPVIGYCSPGGSHLLVRKVAAEVWRYYPDARIFRLGRELNKSKILA
jgi:hypothetical protein